MYNQLNQRIKKRRNIPVLQPESEVRTKSNKCLRPRAHARRVNPSTPCSTIGKLIIIIDIKSFFSL